MLLYNCLINNFIKNSENGITFEMLEFLTDKDIDDLIQEVGLRVAFRCKLKKWNAAKVF